MSDSGQLVSGLPAPPAPVIPLPRVSEAIGVSAPAPQATLPIVRSPTGGMTMGGRPPDTVVGDAGRTPAWQTDPSPVPPALQDYVQRTMTLEGSGKDPRSSAVGGFIDSTWLSLMKKNFPQQIAGMPDDQILSLRSNAGLREQATAAYAAENASILSGAGQPVTPATMRLAHFLGPQGATAVLSAPPNTPISQLLSKKAIDANPGSLAGNTAGGVIDLVSHQMNGDTAHASLPGLRHVAFGSFNQSAMPALERWQADVARRGQEYDAALAEAKDIRSAARSAVGRWAAESDRPPQNMHEAWQAWSGFAGALALLGGMFGRNHTAAISAAGVMLQSANAADEHAYDQAYGKWKDHLDRGLKLVDLLYQDAHSIVEDARKSYDEKVNELNTLSTAYTLNEHLNPQSVTNLGRNMDLARKNQELIESQHETDAIKDLMARDQKENPGHTPGESYVAAKRQMRETNSAASQMMQFKMAEATNLMSQGVSQEEAYRRVGLIPQPRAAGSGSEEAKFIESQVAADRSSKQSKGEAYGPEDEQASRLKAREDWSRSAATGRVAAGRPDTASDRSLNWKMQRAKELTAAGVPEDEAYRRVGLEPQQRPESASSRALQWKMERAKELIAGGMPKDEAYRSVGLEPTQRAAGLENQFIQGRVAQAEAEAESTGKTFTDADRSAAMADAHQEWSRRTAAGRVEAGRAMGPKEQLQLQAYNDLFEAQKEQYRSAHGGSEPQGSDLTKLQTDALRNSGVIHVAASNGELSPESTKMLAQMYKMGDTAVITSLPRGGPARIQVENEVSKELSESGQGPGDVVLNRLKIAEAKAAATTAGRVTVQTEVYSQEAEAQGKEVVRTSKLFPRSNFPAINQALAAYALQTGDPNIIQFGQALNAFINAYGKLSNPTGIGVHDADKARIERTLQEKLSQGQIEAGVEQVVIEGRIVSNAAREAQIKVLSGLVPQAGGAPTPPGGSSPPPSAAPGGVIRYDQQGNRIQ